MAPQSGNGGPTSKLIYKALKLAPGDEPLPSVAEPALSLCDLAKKTLQEALEAVAEASGRRVTGYKIATRAVNYASLSDAYRGLNGAIQMVRTFCGPGAIGELEEWAGAARRIIPSDA